MDIMQLGTISYEGAILITILINIVNAHVKNIEKMAKKRPYDSSASDDP